MSVHTLLKLIIWLKLFSSRWVGQWELAQCFKLPATWVSHWEASFGCWPGGQSGTVICFRVNSASSRWAALKADLKQHNKHLLIFPDCSLKVTCAAVQSSPQTGSPPWIRRSDQLSGSLNTSMFSHVTNFILNMNETISFLLLSVIALGVDLFYWTWDMHIIDLVALQRVLVLRTRDGHL